MLVNRSLTGDFPITHFTEYNFINWNVQIYFRDILLVMDIYKRTY